MKDEWLIITKWLNSALASKSTDFYVNHQVMSDQPPVPRPDKTRKPAPASRQGLAEEDYYFTDEGFLVFTAAYHLKRGYCCKNGCRHCPYGYKKKDG